MRVPVSWLAEYVAIPDDLDELIATLDDLGLVVEGVERVGVGLEGVVVARVESIAPIEGADKIRLATVSDGEGTVEVVCGAWNYEVGSHVPLAPVGTVLPDGMQIARRKLRGVVSNGMLCSSRELGLGDDQSGLLVLEGAPAPGTPLTIALGIVPDTVLDLSIEGNRPDAHCVEGVARDLAARAGVAFAPVTPAPPLPSDGAAAAADEVTVEIDDPDLCGRFVATVLHGVVVGPSPAWLADRLTKCGMRPINNVVDASNYAMLELGQPTHAFDLDRLGGHGLRVRRARPGEHLALLDG
ncbi:MAG TPA: phenylalanine--tRNA ligase beta subunit-related protein, partial [Acidimicrobiales bacterium]|nr:phenylalanine--tRNA ligase beta subunit-related protein [Acidimicrobiales bacterium]